MVVFMKVIDNRMTKFGDNLKETIKPNSKLQVCASIFSMYGFESLKKELNKIETLGFIFTESTFVSNIAGKKESRKFEIDLNSREKISKW